jgi:hypothetical protein
MRTCLVVFFFFFLVSCKDKRIKGAKNDQKDSVAFVIPTFDSAKWNDKILVAIDSFLKKANCSGCINEMYIDKILPDYILITLRSRVYAYNYMSSHNPLYISKLSGKEFYIYTGMEDVLKGDKKHMIIYNDSDNMIFKTWTLIMDKDSLIVDTTEGFPFFPTEELKPYSSHKKRVEFILPSKAGKRY